MIDFLTQSYERLIEKTQLNSKRYLYHDFKPGRLTGLIGARGVGKTTLLLQYIKEHLYQGKKVFYFSADSVYLVNNASLLELVNELYLSEGYKHFFIDEIHKYANWSQELKNLYDSFPDIQIVFSGSSMLDIIKGTYDLSRRAKIYKLPGLSFREYLLLSKINAADPELPILDFQDIINDSTHVKSMVTIDRIKGHFKDYLKKGYYPFAFEDEDAYVSQIHQVIEKTIYEDIANYYNLKTESLIIFKKILVFLASIPPGEVNTNNIAKNLSVAHQTVEHYLSILDSVRLIHMIFPYEGGNQYLRKPQKIFLDNTNLLYALSQESGPSLNIGTLRELFFVQTLHDKNIDVYYSKQGDYRTVDTLFEVGGKNKTAAQLAGSELKKIVVKDDTLSLSKGVLPLIYLGFLY